MEKKHSDGVISKDYYDLIKSKLVEVYPAQAGLNTDYIKKYSEYASKNSTDLDQVSQNF